MKNFPKSISQNRNVAAVKLKWGLNDNCRPFHTKSVQLSVVYIWKDKIMLHVFLCKIKMTQAQLLTFRSTEWLINLLLFHILTYKCNNKKNGIYISIFLPDSAPLYCISAQTLIVLILNYIYIYFFFKSIDSFISLRSAVQGDATVLGGFVLHCFCNRALLISAAFSCFIITQCWTLFIPPPLD